ncbi:BREX system ATP-binding domain-containing protein [Streptomyces sp. NPDC056144]|uniref:BREX system ATP-binding domain-containing protein n=1 Tax=unclassified Streptomyces TaxID=2593676 RepID=UPI0035DF4DD0
MSEPGIRLSGRARHDEHHARRHHAELGPRTVTGIPRTHEPTHEPAHEHGHGHGHEPTHGREPTHGHVRVSSPAVAEFCALGPVQASISGRIVDLGAPKQRTLLALMISQAGQTVTTDVILDALWEGNPPPSAMTSLQAYVAKIRKVLEPGRAPRTPATVLRTRPHGYVLDTPATGIDIHRFTAHADAARHARDHDDPRTALARTDAALALWRGQPFTEVSSVPAVVPEVVRLEEVRLSVLEMRSEALLALGAHETAAAELRAFVKTHPLREYACELLSLALYRSGRQADALDALRTLQTSLAEELGIDPTARLQHLRQQILHQDPTLDFRPTPTAPTTASSPAAGTSPTATAAAPPAVIAAAPPAIPVPAPAPDAAPAPVPVPAPVPASVPASAAAPVSGAVSGGVSVRAGVQDAFVGREAALRQLTEALAAAEAGHGQVVTVTGEPGAGKTSLLRRFAERSGVPVLTATCPEHIAAPPLSLWEQILRAAVAAFPGRPVPAPTTTLLTGTGGVVGAVDGEEELAEAVAGHLTGLSGGGALVVMLDHVHRADAASLRLLALLARRVPGSRILLIVSYRPDEPSVADGQGSAWTVLPGVKTARIWLRGLTPHDAQALAGALIGHEVSGVTAKALCARSGGNPSLLREMIKLLAGEQRTAASHTPVAGPVRDVVLHRVGRLPRPAAELLAVAAVAGRHFDVEVVADVASIEIDTALAVLDHAIAAGLVDEDGDRLGWFRFTDPLVADALYETTGRMRRGRLHLRIEAAAGRAWARPAPPPLPKAPATAAHRT